MNSTERIRKAFGFEPVDRVPVIVLDAGTWIVDREQVSYQELFLRPAGGADLFVRTYDDMGSDATWAPGGTVFMLYALGFPARMDRKGQACESLPFLQDPSQIDDLDGTSIRGALLRSPVMGAILACIDTMKSTLRGRKPVASCGCTAFTTAARMAGVENLLLWMMDGEEALSRLFDYTVELCAQYNALLAEHGVDLVMHGDPVASADMIGGNLYRDTVRLLEGRVAGRGKALYQFLHICGNSSSRLREAHGLGFDGFSLDRVELSEALKDAAGAFAVLGNISPEQLKSGSASSIRMLSEELCLTAGSNGGFLLANGCDVIPGTPLEHIRAMKDGAEAAARRKR